MNLGERDQMVEVELLDRLVQTKLAFVLFQRDWEDLRHGDLDILVSGQHWQTFLETIVKFSDESGNLIVKAYEIEYGVICIVLLTREGAVFLDVALAGWRRSVFGVDLEQALRYAEILKGVPVLRLEDAAVYERRKRELKRGRLLKMYRKLVNVLVISRRVRECSIVFSGGMLYVPYLTDRELLSSLLVRNRAAAYLGGVLRSRYSGL